MMSNGSERQRPPRRPAWSLPHLIKWIVLILLVVLLLFQLASGEYVRLAEASWTAWVVFSLKLLLIAVVVWLMRAQMSLMCEILEPKGCASLQYDAASGSAVIVVRGSAGGGIFTSYTLSLELSGTPLAVAVDYPSGGSVGSVAVTNGELGRLHAGTLEPTTGYTVILTVHGAGGATKVCTASFDLQERVAYIEAIGEVPAQTVGVHPSDPGEPLKWIKETPGMPTPPADPAASVGGYLSVVGGADVFGCDRQMSEWALQHRLIPAGADPWQADAAGPWQDIRVIPIWDTDPNHPRRRLGCCPSLLPNFVLNGDLTREWKSRNVLISVFPQIHAMQRVTVPEDWDTKAGADLNGPYTVRLRVRHDQMAGGGPIEEIHEAVNVWIDNHKVLCGITGLAISGSAPLDGCEQLRLSQLLSGSTANTLDIVGQAWDPLILDPPYPADRPNDNFGHYDLHFKRDGGSPLMPIATGVANPVPSIRQATPIAATNVGVLHSWDIVAALDAGNKPAVSPVPVAPYPKIWRGDSCAYEIRLYVTDTTVINDKADTHDAEDWWPFCIENDLPESWPAP